MTTTTSASFTNSKQKEKPPTQTQCPCQRPIVTAFVRPMRRSRQARYQANLFQTRCISHDNTNKRICRFRTTCNPYTARFRPARPYHLQVSLRIRSYFHFPSKQPTYPDTIHPIKGDCNLHLARAFRYVHLFPRQTVDVSSIEYVGVVAA